MILFENINVRIFKSCGIILWFVKGKLFKLGYLFIGYKMKNDVIVGLYLSLFV